MKIASKTARAGWQELTARIVDFDGVPPMTSLRWQWPNPPASSDRLAVAGALAFASWSAGTLVYEAEFSPLTSQRITEWFRDDGIWVLPVPVRVGALPIPRGTRTLCLGECEESSDATLVAFAQPNMGTALSEDHVRIASNASFFESRGTPDSLALAQLAVAVLVSEDLEVGAIRFPRFFSSSPALADRTAVLLEAVGLGLKA